MHNMSVTIFNVMWHYLEGMVWKLYKEEPHLESCCFC